MSKYGSKKVRYDGKVFDSTLEYIRYTELKALERMGAISSLRTQVKYVLIPAQREQSVKGKRGGTKQGKLIEREVAYYADFVYIDSDGSEVVEDTKGVHTPEYIIKRKLMLYIHGIRIREVTDKQYYYKPRRAKK